ncbi:ATP-dependent DNA helicase [Trichonephila clavipes]|nr:ATP-dependent DNA helicase [Trichonephila clavipes]
MMSLITAATFTNETWERSVPIARRTSTVKINNNKTIFAKQSHLPIVSACAITILKSQGGTFNEIANVSDKTHLQQLEYATLFRRTSIEGLYIVTSNKDSTFYYGKRRTTPTLSLQEELRRLSLNGLVTVEEDMTNFISGRSGAYHFSLLIVSVYQPMLCISQTQ